MILYTYPGAPNPRRLEIFMREKGIELNTQHIDLRKGENKSQAFLAINPNGTVPVLVLDNGTVLTEVIEIISYLEELHPNPPLLGETAEERAQVLGWDHRCYCEGLEAIAEVMRNENPAFKNRALPGPVAHAQIPELIARGRKRTTQFFEVLEKHLSKRDFMVGDKLTLADIDAYVIAEFAGWIKHDVAEQNVNLQLWLGSMYRREAFRKPE